MFCTFSCESKNKYLKKFSFSIENESVVDTIMATLNKSVNSRIMSALGRDVILELIMKNIEYEALNWGWKLVTSDGNYMNILFFPNLLIAY